jgi:hypothetical protein
LPGREYEVRNPYPMVPLTGIAASLDANKLTGKRKRSPANGRSSIYFFGSSFNDAEFMQ